MKTKFYSIFMALVLTVLTTSYMDDAVAGGMGKAVGPVISITLSDDGSSAIAVLKNNKDGEEINISVSDELTLDKLKDKRIVIGDEIRARWKKDGKNTSKSFKKTAGC